MTAQVSLLTGNIVSNSLHLTANSFSATCWTFLKR